MHSKTSKSVASSTWYPTTVFFLLLHTFWHKKYQCIYHIWSNTPIISQDSEHKHTSKINQRSRLCWKFGKSSRPRGQQSLTWGTVSSRWDLWWSCWNNWNWNWNQNRILHTKNVLEGNFLALNGTLLQGQQSDPAEIWTPLRFYAYSSCKQFWRRSDWKWTSFFFHDSRVRNSKMIDQIWP